MEIRYIGPVEELILTPVGHPEVTVKRLEWFDAAADVVGKRPSGTPDSDKFDPGLGLLAQGEWSSGKFEPYWELAAAKKAQRTRAENAAASGEEE